HPLQWRSARHRLQRELSAGDPPLHPNGGGEADVQGAGASSDGGTGGLVRSGDVSLPRYAVEIARLALRVCATDKERARQAKLVGLSISTRNDKRSTRNATRVRNEECVTYKPGSVERSRALTVIPLGA